MLIKTVNFKLFFFRDRGRNCIGKLLSPLNDEDRLLDYNKLYNRVWMGEFNFFVKSYNQFKFKFQKQSFQ